MCVLAGKMCVSVCGLVNWPLMVVVLFMKNVAKSSAVRVEKRGEGFEKHARVRRIVNFVMTLKDTYYAPF